MPTQSHGAQIHRLSFVIGLCAGAACLLSLFALSFLGVRTPLWAAGACSVLVGLGTYRVTTLLVRPRLRRALEEVLQIRQEHFQAAIENAPEDRQDELGALATQIHRTGLDARAKMQELERIEHYRREFLGNVSHELKTPIFSIRGFAETLLDGALDDEAVRRTFVQRILHNAERIGNLAEDLGEVARIEMGELSMHIRPFSLVEVAREVTESLEPLASSLDVTLRHRVPVELPSIQGDRKRIQQVLSNLIDNAVKYSKAGGHVELGARLLPSGQVKVSVVDDGIGIAPEHMERLTERFFRVDTSRSRSQGGTGLGLAIVKHILGAHDSRLMIESTLGSGSTFGFSLPSEATAPPASQT